jgi:hypothetical protein
MKFKKGEKFKEFSFLFGLLTASRSGIAIFIA